MPDGVQFEENNDLTMSSFKSRRILGEAETPKIIQYLIKKGIARDARQSYHILLGTIVLSIVLAIVIFSYFVLGIGVSKKTVYKIPLELKMQIEASKQDSNQYNLE